MLDKLPGCERLAWMDHAACANRGTKQPRVDFFPKQTTATHAREAKAICQRCCVRDECLAYALATENHQRHGIWGGMTPEERAKIA